MDTKKLVLDAEGASFVSTLFNNHGDIVYRYLLKNMKDKELAKDITSTTFLKIAEFVAKGGYNKKGKDKSLLLTTAHNEMVNYFRYARKFASKDESDKLPNFPDTKPDPLEILERLNLRNKIDSLVERLPEDLRRIFILRFYLDMPFWEIAEKMNVANNSTLRNKIRRAKESLQNMFEGKHPPFAEDESPS